MLIRYIHRWRSSAETVGKCQQQPYFCSVSEPQTHQLGVFPNLLGDIHTLHPGKCSTSNMRCAERRSEKSTPRLGDGSIEPWNFEVWVSWRWSVASQNSWRDFLLVKLTNRSFTSKVITTDSPNPRSLMLVAHVLNLGIPKNDNVYWENDEPLWYGSLAGCACPPAAKLCGQLFDSLTSCATKLDQLGMGRKSCCWKANLDGGILNVESKPKNKKDLYLWVCVCVCVCGCVSLFFFMGGAIAGGAIVWSTSWPVPSSFLQDLPPSTRPLERLGRCVDSLTQIGPTSLGGAQHRGTFQAGSSHLVRSSQVYWLYQRELRKLNVWKSDFFVSKKSKYTGLINNLLESWKFWKRQRSCRLYWERWSTKYQQNQHDGSLQYFLLGRPVLGLKCFSLARSVRAVRKNIQISAGTQWLRKSTLGRLALEHTIALNP